MANVIMESVTIMASVTYGKFNLWQVLLMANVIMANVFMAKVLWKIKLSLYSTVYQTNRLWMTHPKTKLSMSTALICTIVSMSTALICTIVSIEVLH